MTTPLRRFADLAEKERRVLIDQSKQVVQHHVKRSRLKKLLALTIRASTGADDEVEAIRELFDQESSEGQYEQWAADAIRRAKLHPEDETRLLVGEIQDAEPAPPDPEIPF